MATDISSNVIASRGLPLPQSVDGQPVRSRGGPYGDTVVQFSSERQSADEGSLFVATNPTPGTGIIFNAAGEGAAYAVATKASILALFNGNKSDGRCIYPVSYALHCMTAAPTGTLEMNFAHKIQTSTRDAISNNVLIRPVAISGGLTARSAAIIHVPTASLLTHATDGADMRLVGRSRIQTGVCVVGDTYELQYGVPVGQKAGLTAARATDPARCVGEAPAVVVAPGEWYVLNFWWITQAAQAFTVEFELKYIER